MSTENPLQYQLVLERKSNVEKFHTEAKNILQWKPVFIIECFASEMTQTVSGRA